MPPKHTIEIVEISDERSSWECDCGRAGSADTFTVDIAAEKHVPEGHQVVHRYPAGGAR